MNAQIQIKPFAIFNLFGSLLSLHLIPAEPFSVTSLDYGFDHDETELAEELTTHLPIESTEQPDPEIEAEDFETQYKWFIS